MPDFAVIAIEADYIVKVTSERSQGSLIITKKVFVVEILTLVSYATIEIV